jgi:hypothetical protein
MTDCIDFKICQYVYLSACGKYWGAYEVEEGHGNKSLFVGDCIPPLNSYKIVVNLNGAAAGVTTEDSLDTISHFDGPPHKGHGLTLVVSAASPRPNINIVKVLAAGTVFYAAEAKTAPAGAFGLRHDSAVRCDTYGI